MTGFLRRVLGANAARAGDGPAAGASPTGTADQRPAAPVAQVAGSGAPSAARSSPASVTGARQAKLRQT